jgi:hypothetical protein
MQLDIKTSHHYNQRQQTKRQNDKWKVTRTQNDVIQKVNIKTQKWEDSRC